MSADVHTCETDATVNELMEVMTERRFRHVPWSTTAGSLGIISIGDVVKSRMSELRVRARPARLLRAQQPDLTQLTQTVLVAAGTFVATNVDDLVVLIVLFATTRRDGLRRWEVVVGQYAGIATLVAVSALAALGLLVVPDRSIGLLGLVPITLGVRGLVPARRARPASGPSPRSAAGSAWPA